MLGFLTNIVGFVLSDRVLDDDGACGPSSFAAAMSITASLYSRQGESPLIIIATKRGMESDPRLGGPPCEAGIPLKWGPGRHGPGDNLFIFIHDVDAIGSKYRPSSSM